MSDRIQHSKFFKQWLEDERKFQWNICERYGEGHCTCRRCEQDRSDYYNRRGIYAHDSDYDSDVEDDRARGGKIPTEKMKENASFEHNVEEKPRLRFRIFEMPNGEIAYEGYWG